MAGNWRIEVGDARERLRALPVVAPPRLEWE